MPLPMVRATPSPSIAPIIVNTVANPSASLGVNALVVTEVAIELAVS